MAFGPLKVAIIRIIRAVVACFQRKLKQTHNKAAEYLLCCVQCCLGCLERCIHFVSIAIYIATAIYAYPFCDWCYLHADVPRQPVCLLLLVVDSLLP